MKAKYINFLSISTTLICLFMQILLVVITEPIEIRTLLFYHKTIFLLIFMIGVFNYIKGIFTNPGIITHKNNIAIIEYYLNNNLRYAANAKIANKTLKKKKFSRKIYSMISDSECSYDSGCGNRKGTSSIDNRFITHTKKEFGIKLTRCRGCECVRIATSHHCFSCDHCVIGRFKHSYQLGKCLGQLNLKFYILFCLFTLISCLYSLSIVVYYIFYGKGSLFFHNKALVILVLFHNLSSFFYAIYMLKMLTEIYLFLKTLVLLIDFKKNRYVEAKQFSDCLIQIFGNKLGISWILPINKNYTLNKAIHTEGVVVMNNESNEIGQVYSYSEEQTN